jgi:large subunit ribosomal protein L23
LFYFFISFKPTKIKAMNGIGAGPRIYFPNVVFAILKRPEHLKSNQALFKVPEHLNKFDIRNYLESIYGVKVTQVNTVRILGKFRRDAIGRMVRMPNWKKAYVTLDKDFDYPPPFDRDNFMKG